MQNATQTANLIAVLSYVCGVLWLCVVFVFVVVCGCVRGFVFVAV